MGSGGMRSLPLRRASYWRILLWDVFAAVLALDNERPDCEPWIMTGDLIRASVLTLVAAIISANAAAAGSAFDGTWSVTAVTQQGGCDSTYNFSVQIAAGLITLPGFAGLSGHVADSGAVQASVSTSGTQVTALGNLARSAGRGQWSSHSHDGTCSGYWTARAAAR